MNPQAVEAPGPSYAILAQQKGHGLSPVAYVVSRNLRRRPDLAPGELRPAGGRAVSDS
jgi:hypothetical protein